MKVKVKGERVHTFGVEIAVWDVVAAGTGTPNDRINGIGRAMMGVIRVKRTARVNERNIALTCNQYHMIQYNERYVE
jgi:hypothetical protein